MKNQALQKSPWNQKRQHENIIKKATDMCAWRDGEQISKASPRGEPVFGSIHVQDISTTHNYYDDARGSSPLVSPVSTPPHQAHGCVLDLSQIKIQ